MVWLNIDIPTKREILHSESCFYVQYKSETPNKGINHLKRDGGWLPFQTMELADEYCKSKCFTMKRGQCCMG